MVWTRLGFIVVFPLAFGLLVGCSSPVSTFSQEELQIKKIALLYGKYLSKHKGIGPENTKRLLAFAKTLAAEELAQIGIDRENLETTFISPRDNQEYVIRKFDQSKAMLDASTQGSGGVVVYEKVGDGAGNRFVAYSFGKTEQLNAAEFQKKVPEAK